MHKMLFIYNGTIGSILSSYVEKNYRVTVLDFVLDSKDLDSENLIDDIALVLVVGQEFPPDVYTAIRRLSENAPIVWLCQDKNNQELPDKSVQRIVCDG